MDILDLIIKLSSLIVAVGVILSNINKIFNPIYKKINELEKNQCKNFLARKENNEKITDSQINRAYEVYDQYINDLKGNSFIKDKWEMLMDNEH